MECVWSINRYSRCYTDFSKQASNVDGNFSLFPYMTQSSCTQSGMHSQLVNTGVWSTIMRHQKVRLSLILKLVSEKVCSLQVRLDESFEDWELEIASQMRSVPSEQRQSRSIMLEQVDFPESFRNDFKVSPKTECIAFRYTRGSERFSFQIDFDSAFECYMCHHMMFRFGILHPQWSDMHNIELNDGLNFQRETHRTEENYEQIQNNRHLERHDIKLVDFPTPPAEDDFTQIPHPISIMPAPPMHESAILQEEASTKENLDDSAQELCEMFRPSQPLSSLKFLSSQTQCSAQTVPEPIEEPPACSTQMTPLIDLDDENIFLPLSFQQFGYESG